ncbi:RDD family protein [Nocardioides panacisoli]|uniref:RDD family protein n=1 Tax=Nocardioides panacisoli TaxID=627624 RepID=UPI001C625645|nr:RDD family protein [Nocardioides panacisoli]QYJ05333.1 RDD family protein [Nocardioides panacisoli]
MVADPTFATASWGRRAAALFVDWIACTLAVIAVVGLDAYSEPASSAQWWVLAAYVAQSALLTWLVGGSFGKLLLGLRVVPADGRMLFINPLRILVRQAAIVLVIPPLVFRPDGRGLHDLMAGTATVSRTTFQELMGRAGH